jgi:predicted ATPase with chaperone activity
MAGPPGTGKSMLAARFPGILPAMSEEESLQAAAVASLTSASVWKTGSAGRFAPRTTLPRRWRWWAAAAIRDRAKSRSPTTACCF